MPEEITSQPKRHRGRPNILGSDAKTVHIKMTATEYAKAKSQKNFSAMVRAFVEGLIMKEEKPAS